MTTASMPPDKLILLAAVGIGAYWFLNRRAMAAGTGGLGASPASLFGSSIAGAGPAAAAAANYAANDSKLWASVGNLLGTTIGKFTTSTAPNVFQQANAALSGGSSGTSGAGRGGDPYNSSDDSYAINPAPQLGSVWDFTQEYWY